MRASRSKRSAASAASPSARAGTSARRAGRAACPRPRRRRPCRRRRAAGGCGVNMDLLADHERRISMPGAVFLSRVRRARRHAASFPRRRRRRLAYRAARTPLRPAVSNRYVRLPHFAFCLSPSAIGLFTISHRLSAVIASILAARRAGIVQATPATTARTRPTTAYVAGSDSVTPNRNPARNRLVAAATTKPRISPRSP